MRNENGKFFLLLIVVIGLICIFLFFLNSKKGNRNSKDYEILNSIDTTIEVIQVSEKVENSINGAVTYLYSDSTKQNKINVSKKDFSANEWLIIVNTDSLKVNEDTLKLVISDVYEKKPTITETNVVLLNGEKNHRNIRRSIKMNEGGLYTIIPSVRGVNSLNITIQTNKGIVKRVYKFYAY